MTKTFTIKIICYAVVLSALGMPASGFAQSTKEKPKAELSWKPFETGFAKANTEKKKVLLDVYTDWCGWCKRLDKDVYSDKRVVDYLTEHYYVVKLNAEDTASVTYKDKKSTKPQFAGAFGVKGYPTIIFFDSKGDPITSLPGYVDADKFLTIAKFIGEDYYKSMSWENYQKMNEPKNPKE